MCRKDQCHALFGKLKQQGDHLICPLAVQPRGGLVQQQDIGLHRYGPCNGDTLLLTARKHMRWSVRKISNSECGKRTLNPQRCVSLAQTLVERAERHVLSYGRGKDLVIRVLQYQRYVTSPAIEPSARIVAGLVCEKHGTLVRPE